VVDGVIGSSAYLINDCWLEIDEYGTWDVFSGTCLGEEGVERVFGDPDRFVGRHLSVVVDAMFKAE